MIDPWPSNVPRAVIVRAGLTPGAAVLVVAAVVTAFVLADAFVLAHRTIGWVVACSVVALLIDPLVDFVDRLLPRWIAVIVVLLGVLAVVAAVTVGLANDLARLARRAQGERARGGGRAGGALRLAGRDRRRRRGSTDFVDDLDARVRKDAVSEAVETVPTYVVTGILMLFLLAYGRRYFDGFVDQFGEARRDDIRTRRPAARRCAAGATSSSPSASRSSTASSSGGCAGCSTCRPRSASASSSACSPCCR